MNISPINIYKLNNISKKSIPAKSPSFKAQIKQMPVVGYGNIPKSILKKVIADNRASMLTKINDENEYKEILDKTFKYLIEYENFVMNLVIRNGYEKTPVPLQGLISYCGAGDLSDVINSWLTVRHFNAEDKISDEQISNIIRVLEYSLNRLDEKFGKYEGRVYRVGYFNPHKDKQFYSTSKKMGCIYLHSQENPPGPIYPYSIIKIKNGHEIHKFQEFTNTFMSKKFAKAEKEILIDRNSNFRKVPFENYSNDDINDILTLLNISEKVKIRKEDLDRFNRSIDTLNYISVWEEI